MPITPKFSLSQTDSCIIVDIRVPHVRVTTESIQVSMDTDTSTSEIMTPISESSSSTLMSASTSISSQQPTTSTIPVYNVLHFSSPPYLLVLNFAPRSFHPNAGEACATYDPQIQGGTIRLSLQKAHEGQVWKNLDLVGRLAQPTKQQERSPSSNWLQAISSNDGDENDAITDAEEGDSPAQHAEDNEDGEAAHHANNTSNGCYGALRMFRGIFTDLNRDGLAREMLEMPWDEESATTHTNLSSMLHERTTSDETTIPHNPLDDIFRKRRQERMETEQDAFDVERWRGDIDIEDDYVYLCAMDMEPHWRRDSHAHQPTQQEQETSTLLSDQMSALSISPAVESLDDRDSKFFTDSETLELHSIPYPLLPTHISEETRLALLLTTSDILFAYVYDHLTTSGDPTVESAWTISILSASLSCLEDFQDWVTQHQGDDYTSLLVASSLRRSLIYPYIRNLSFARHCAQAVADICKSGPRCMIRCLLQVRQILHVSELYYLGNKLFVDPILLWLQRDIEELAASNVIGRFAVQYESALKEVSDIQNVGLEFSPEEDEEFDSSTSSSSSSDEDDE